MILKLGNLQSLQPLKSFSLEEVKQMQEKSLNDWQTAINKIGKKDKIQQQEKIRQLFNSWDKLGNEQEQQETLDIIQSLENVSI